MSDTNVDGVEQCDKCGCLKNVEAPVCSKCRELEQQKQQRMSTDKALNPWHPIANAVDLKHLGKLGEELGECSAAVSRCIIQGVNGTEPVTGKVNREWLEDEIADVLGNVKLVIERFGLNVTRIDERADQKAARLRTWHDMA